MQPMDLPPDLKRHIRKNVVLYLIKLILWEIAMVIVNASLWDQLVAMPSLHMGVIVISVLLPPVLIGVPKEFLHSTVVGTVKAVHFKEETGSYRVGIRFFPYTRQVILFDVVTEEGTTIRMKAREYGERSHAGFSVPFEGDIQHHLDDFSEGDTVYRFRGLPYPFVVTQRQKETEECIICGSESPCNESVCHHCGHTLLKAPQDGDTEATTHV